MLCMHDIVCHCHTSLSIGQKNRGKWRGKKSWKQRVSCLCELCVFLQLLPQWDTYMLMIQDFLLTTTVSRSTSWLPSMPLSFWKQKTGECIHQTLLFYTYSDSTYSTYAKNLAEKMSYYDWSIETYVSKDRDCCTLSTVCLTIGSGLQWWLHMGPGTCINAFDFCSTNPLVESAIMLERKCCVSGFIVSKTMPTMASSWVAIICKLHECLFLNSVFVNRVVPMRMPYCVSAVEFIFFCFDWWVV